MREQVLDPGASEIAETLDDYAKLLRTIGRTAEADRLEARAIGIRGS